MSARGPSLFVVMTVREEKLKRLWKANWVDRWQLRLVGGAASVSLKAHLQTAFWWSDKKYRSFRLEILLTNRHKFTHFVRKRWRNRSTRQIPDKTDNKCLRVTGCLWTLWPPITAWNRDETPASPSKPLNQVGLGDHFDPVQQRALSRARNWQISKHRVAWKFCGSFILRIGDFLWFAGTSFCGFRWLKFLVGTNF